MNRCLALLFNALIAFGAPIFVATVAHAET